MTKANPGVRKLVNMPPQERPAADSVLKVRDTGEMYWACIHHKDAGLKVILERGRRFLRVECEICLEILARFEVKL